MSLSTLRRRLAKQAKQDGGYTLIEVAIAGLLSSILLIVIGTFMINVLKAGSFTQGQSASLNDARLVMMRIEKEARGANSIDWCEEDGSCLEVDAQTPDGDFALIRYTHVDQELRRSEFDTGTATWGTPATVIQRVANSASQPVFSNSACDDTSITFQRVVVDLYIEPTPTSDPVLHFQTSFRPRNFPSVAICPEA